MALVRYPLGEQRSGRTGGVVHSHNRGGPYNRAASIPVNPNTPRQSAVRANLSNLSNNWFIGLTQDQRDGWDQYAANNPISNRLGMSIFLTSQNYYIRGNSPRLQAGLDVVDDAPVTVLDAEVPAFLSATASAATQIISVSWMGFAYWADVTGSAMLVSVGRPQGASRKFFGSPFRYNDAVLGDGTTAPTAPAALAVAPWILAEGQRIFIKARISEYDGRLGAWAVYNFLCAA